jgi:hypothetical protein
LAKERFAFRKGSVTTDLIFGIRQLIKKNWKKEKELIMIFIDYKEASDSIRKEEICRSLEKLGISTNLLREVENRREKL